MVNFIRQKEIEELSQLLSDVGILPLNIINKLLKFRGKSEEQIDIILNQMVKKKLAYYDDAKAYLRINKGIKTNDSDVGYCKSIWLLIDLINNISDYYIIHGGPKKLTFINKNIKDNRDPFFDVYYVPYGSEKLNVYKIINDKKDDSITKCFIIIDDISQIKNIKLNEKFKIYNFVTIDSNGNVKYIECKEKDEVNSEQE